MVRPSQLYRVAVTVFKTRQPLIIRASISRDGVEMSTDSKGVTEGIPETLLMRVSCEIYKLDSFSTMSS